MLAGNVLWNGSLAGQHWKWRHFCTAAMLGMVITWSSINASAAAMSQGVNPTQLEDFRSGNSYQTGSGTIQRVSAVQYVVIDDTVSLTIPYQKDKETVLTLRGSLRDQSDLTGETIFEALESEKVITLTISKTGVVTVSGDGGSLPVDDDGNEIQFAIDEANGMVIGNVVVSFKVTQATAAAMLEGKTAVVYETLMMGDVAIASHTDITDEDQTIHYPKIRTEATSYSERENEDWETRHTVSVNGVVTILDKVYYENLVPGTTYLLNAKLWNETIGSFVATEGVSVTDPSHLCGDNPVSAECTFVATSSDGSVYVPISFDGKKELVDGEAELTVHMYLSSVDEEANVTLLASHDEATFSINDQNDGIGEGENGSKEQETVYLKNLFTDGSLVLLKQDSYSQGVNGVEFVLYAADRTDNNDTAVTYTSDMDLEEVLITQHKSVKISTGHGSYSVNSSGNETTVETDGLVVLEHLPIGIYYLEEVKTAADSKGNPMSLLAEPIEIQIPKVLTEAEFEKSGISEDLAYHDTEAKTWTVYQSRYVVTDHATFLLPNTGGNGFWMIGMIGLAMGMAGVYLVIGQKKKTE